jgi:osmoprotectant transport system permease protein
MCPWASAVPAEVLDAADGMGFGNWQRLRKIELPLALPYIVSGLRIATVTVIGIATVAAYINAGGLGTIIFAGIDQRYPEKIIVGGLLTSLLAIGADVLLSRIERRLRAHRAV